MKLPFKIKKLFFALGILVLLLVLLYLGLDVDLGQPPLELSGTFSNDTINSDSITFTFSKTPVGYVARGTIGGKRVLLSGLTTLRIEGMLIGSAMRPLPVSVELALDGSTITLQGLEKPVMLRPGGSIVPVHPGAFTGHYKSGNITEPIGFIDLVQDGSLLVGSGNLFGQPMNMAGIVHQDNTIKGIISFAGEIESIFNAEIKGNSLTIHGLGEPLVFRRD